MENKRSYITPQVELVELDNEISLVLESNPPIGPEETTNIHNSNPFFIIV